MLSWCSLIRCWSHPILLYSQWGLNGSTFPKAENNFPPKSIWEVFSPMSLSRSTTSHSIVTISSVWSSAGRWIITVSIEAKPLALLPADLAPLEKGLLGLYDLESGAVLMNVDLFLDKAGWSIICRAEKGQLRHFLIEFRSFRSYPWIGKSFWWGLAGLGTLLFWLSPLYSDCPAWWLQLKLCWPKGDTLLYLMFCLTGQNF